MKSSRIFIVIGCVLFLSLSRTAAAAEYSGGARLGIGVSSIFGDSVQNLSPRFGFNIGLYATEWLSAKWGLQQELVIGARGSRWTSDPTLTLSTSMAYSNYATNFTYLEIPLLVKWRISDNEAVRPALYLGPTFAFPLVAEADYQGSLTDLMQKTNRFDFDVTAGASLDIRRDNFFIPIDIRYTLGLTNYAKGNADIDYYAHLRHGVFSISVGLGHLVDFKKKKD
jgi:hypothetical protein